MKVQNAAMALRRKRIEVAQTLQKADLEQACTLGGLPHVVFAIEVSERERSVHGADQIDFLFSANLGEPMRSLKEIASGGELSRVMLAVKTVLAEADDVETLVFDEVDAGIGGAVAIAVGEQMAKLGRCTSGDSDHPPRIHRLEGQQSSRGAQGYLGRQDIYPHSSGWGRGSYS